MKILLTGGAGFIGSHIVDGYIKLNYKVVIIDDLSTGFKKNINKKAKFYKADIRDRSLLEKIFIKEKPEIVNHHAARISVVESLRLPEEVFAVNVLGTINLLELSRRFKVKKFIFASTGGALYGSPKILPVKENAEIKPESPYGFSKLLAEECIGFYYRIYGLPFLILRYANIYGPRQNPKGEAGVIAIFAGLMLKGRQPTIFGDGSKTRDYVYVDDIVKVNILALEKGFNEILNIGCAKELRDDEVFKVIAKFTVFKKEPIFSSFRPGEVRRICLDSKKAKKVLGWLPKTDFEMGSKRTVEWLFKQYRK